MTDREQEIQARCEAATLTTQDQEQISQIECDLQACIDPFIPFGSTRTSIDTLLATHDFQAKSLRNTKFLLEIVARLRAELESMTARAEAAEQTLTAMFDEPLNWCRFCAKCPCAKQGEPESWMGCDGFKWRGPDAENRPEGGPAPDEAPRL